MNGPKITQNSDKVPAWVYLADVPPPTDDERIPRHDPLPAPRRRALGCLVAAAIVALVAWRMR